MKLTKYKLGDIAEIVPGYAFKASDFGTGDNIALKIKDISPFTVDTEGADRVLYTPNDRFKVKTGDYVMAMTGATIGKVGKILSQNKNIFINQRVCKFIPNESICNKDFLFYVLNTEYFKQFVYNNVDSKAAQPNIGHPTLYKFDIELPDLDTQRRIASVLSNLDRKIALNRQINTNLEALARQLYDYWFVQFDFPDANGKPYKSSGGEMVYNEQLKREIPKGWEVKKVGDKMRIFTGKKDVSKAIPGDYKFFSCAPDPVTSNEYIYDGAAVLVSGNGSYTGRVTYYNGKFDLYQRTYACVMEEMPESIAFFYYTLKYLFQPVYSGGKHGSSIPYIVLGDLADFIYAFDSVIVEDFNKRVKSIFDLQFKNMEQISSLTRQRDELLPLLMNGQVSVE